MSMKIPWPEGTTPEEMRRRTAERQEQFRKEEEKRRAAFEATLARKDVRELAAIWHKAVGDACNAYNGPTRLDLEELEQVTFELAIGAEVARKPHRSMGQLRGVLREMINGSLSNDRSSFAHSQQLTLLRASAALEIDGLVLAHEAALRRGTRSPESEAPKTASPQESPTASAGSRIEGEPPQPMASPHPEDGATVGTTVTTAQSLRRRFHESVIGVAVSLSNVLLLLRRETPPDRDLWPGYNLLWLDQHWLDLDKSPADADPSARSKAWRTTLLKFREHLAVARRLWEQDTAGPDSRLSLDFARVSKGIVACGLLTDATFHGLVITLAKVVLDPRAPGAVPQYALAAIGPGSSDPQTLAGVARLQTVSDLESRPWWRTMELGLDQEYANVLSLPSLGNHEPAAAQAPDPAPLQVRGNDEPPNSLQAHIEGKSAAKLIGVGASTLSRWRSKAPKWAASNTQQFGHLMERDPESYYYRDRVIKLAKWFQKGQESGGQTEVECP